MKYKPAVTRIAHDLCDLMDDEWAEGRKLYMAKAQEIYAREVKPLRNLLLLITAAVDKIMDTALSHVLCNRLSRLVTLSNANVAVVNTQKGTPH